MKTASGSSERDVFRSVDNEDDVKKVADEQLKWYSDRRTASRRMYQGSELVLLVAAASTTVAAAIGARPLVTALLSAVTVLLTGYRQTFDPHGRWIACSLAWMDARSAIWEYEFQGAHDSAARRKLISELDEIAKIETGQWVAGQRLRRALTGGTGQGSESGLTSERRVGASSQGAQSGEPGGTR